MMLLYRIRALTATSLEFAYATMSDVSCIISVGSHDHSLASYALSDVHHMIQVRCDQMKIKGIQHKYHVFLNVIYYDTYHIAIIISQGLFFTFSGAFRNTLFVP